MARKLQLQSVLSEYSVLRSEIDTAGGNLYAASWQGALALGAVYAAGAAVAGDNNLAAALVFGAGGAGIAIFFVILWAEEVFRLIRAGRYVKCYIEPKVNHLSGKIRGVPPQEGCRGNDSEEQDALLEAPLAFERYLSSQPHRTQFSWFAGTHYRLTYLAFSLIGLAGPVIAIILMSQESRWWLPVPSVGVILLVVISWHYIREVWRMMDDQYDIQQSDYQAPGRLINGLRALLRMRERRA